MRKKKRSVFEVEIEIDPFFLSYFSFVLLLLFVITRGRLSALLLPGLNGCCGNREKLSLVVA